MPSLARDYSLFFGYGSLMWKPGFDHAGMHHATLQGYSRELCIYSWHWRGTRQCPGLVMGLSPGGRCRGRLISAPADKERDILAYLDERELVTDVYQRRYLDVELEDGSSVPAWCYVARTDHPQFAGSLDVARMLPIVRQGQGHGGANVDYVRATVEHMNELGIVEAKLQDLLCEL